MEGFGNVALFIIMGAGFILFAFRKARILGIILIILALTFYFVVPTFTFWKYKRDSIGTYSDHKGTEIFISSKGAYKIRYNGNAIGEGNIQYSDKDAYLFTFDNNSQLISTTEGEITQVENDQIKYTKLE